MIDKQMRLSCIFLLLAALLAAMACGGGTVKSSTPDTMPTPSGAALSKDVQPIFNTSCVVCHQGAGQAGLTLEPGKSYSNLVNVPSTESPLKRVVPGASDQSYLLAKLSGTQVQVGGSGAQMPFGAPPLSQAQISVIQQWIQLGAPNN